MKNACDPHQFQYPFLDLDGDRTQKVLLHHPPCVVGDGKKTLGDHPEIGATKSGWLLKSFVTICSSG